MTVAVPQARFADTLRYILSHRATHVAVFVWVLANVAAYLLASGSIPFDMPPMHDLPFGIRMLIPTISLIQVFALMGIEAVVAARNARALRAQGAIEPPGDVFGAMQFAYPTDHDPCLLLRATS